MKTRIFYSLFMLVFFNIFTFAQVNPVIPYTAPAAPLGPYTTIEFNETTFDFGTVMQGEKVSHVYTFTNTGEEPLILSNAKGSCGCTIPSWPKSAIAPGETASITVEFDSRNKKGPRNQKVTLTANTDPPQSFLYLKGVVEVPASDSNVEISAPNPTEDLTNMDCVAIYPNPTSDVLKLDLKESIGKSATVSIWSKDGQLMAKRLIPNVEETIEFSVDHYPTGAYIANIQIEGQERVARCFMVNH